MTHPEYLRLRTRALRVEQRLTLDQLVERLALPRTTVYHWIKDLPLGRPRSSVGQQKGTAAMQAKYRQLREEAYAQGRVEFDQLVALPTFRDFVVLYIAEGYKRDRNAVRLGNSDERVVMVAAGWMTRLSSKQLGYQLQYHADQHLDELRAFWGDLLGVDGDLIRLQRKSNSGQLNGRRWRSQQGVLTVAVNDTLLRARLQAWMDCVREAWG